MVLSLIDNNFDINITILILIFIKWIWTGGRGDTVPVSGKTPGPIRK